MEKPTIKRKWNEVIEEDGDANGDAVPSTSRMRVELVSDSEPILVNEATPRVETEVLNARTQGTSDQSPLDLEQEINHAFLNSNRFLKEFKEMLERCTISRKAAYKNHLLVMINEEKITLQIYRLLKIYKTNEMRIRNAFQSGFSAEIIARKNKNEVTRLQFRSLLKTEQLNDGVINCYMALILSRSKEDRNRPSVHVFDSFFWVKLKSSGPSSLKSWTKNIDIFGVDMVLIPIHMQNHWCMLCINIKKKNLMLYDSLNCSIKFSLFFKEIKEFIKNEYNEKKNAVFDTSGWTLGLARDIPQQDNPNDCGVFACQFAEYLSRNAKIGFTQVHMPYFRKKMAYEILEVKKNMDSEEQIDIMVSQFLKSKQ